MNTKKLAALAPALALFALSCAAQDLGGIKLKTLEYKPIQYRPLTNATIAYKPLPGALTNAPVRQLRPGQSPYGAWAQGYNGPAGADYSYGYNSPYVSGSGWGYNNGLVNGYGFTVRSSSCTLHNPWN